MLEEKGASYHYRDYTKKPLSQAEIKRVLGYLGLKPKEVLRKNDKAYRDNGLSGEETAAELIRLMAKHPTLLQRPIGVVDKRAVIGRPAARLLELL